MNSDFRTLVVVLLVTLALVGTASGAAVAGSVGSDYCTTSVGGFDDGDSSSDVGTDCGGSGPYWCVDYIC